MSKFVSGAGSPANGDDCRRLLRVIARKGAKLLIQPCGAAVLVRVGEISSTPGGVFSAACWWQAVEQHWVRRDGDDEAWQLTQRGRQQLKRLSSEQGVPSSARAKASKSESTAVPLRLPVTNIAESPLAWLRHRRDKEGRPLITQIEFDAGERLRGDFHFAHMEPRVTANWSGETGVSAGRRSAPGTGVEIQDSVIAAAERVRRALAAVGPELSGILFDVCCHLKGLEAAERAKGWPQRSAKIVLQLALQRLASHYGMDRPQYLAAGPRAAIRHWGSEDYRPAIDARASDDGAG